MFSAMLRMNPVGALCSFDEKYPTSPIKRAKAIFPSVHFGSVAIDATRDTFSNVKTVISVRAASFRQQLYMKRISSARS